MHVAVTGTCLPYAHTTCHPLLLQHVDKCGGRAALLSGFLLGPIILQCVQRPAGESCLASKDHSAQQLWLDEQGLPQPAEHAISFSMQQHIEQRSTHSRATWPYVPMAAAGGIIPSALPCS